MITKTVREVRDIAKEEGLCGYYKLWKVDLTVFFSEQSTQEMSTSTQRTKKYKKTHIYPVKIVPHPQEMGKLEEQGIAKRGPVVKKKA